MKRVASAKVPTEIRSLRDLLRCFRLDEADELNELLRNDADLSAHGIEAQTPDGVWHRPADAWDSVHEIVAFRLLAALETNQGTGPGYSMKSYQYRRTPVMTLPVHASTLKTLLNDARVAPWSRA